MTSQTTNRARPGARRPRGERRHRRWLPFLLAFGAVALTAGSISVLAMTGSAPRTPAAGAATGTPPSGIPSAKAALIQRVDGQGASTATNDAAAKAAAIAAGAPAIPSFTPPTRIEGIQKTNQGPFPASDFLVRDFWEAPIGQTWYLVYAGDRPDDPATVSAVSQGSLAVYTQGADPNTEPVFQGFYAAPASSGGGPLTITAASGDVLTVQSDGGQIYTFDVVTHAFS